MNASKAKRRLLQWHRYLAATRSMPNHKSSAGCHYGHSKAYSDYMFARRWAPKGLRAPWGPLANRGDA